MRTSSIGPHIFFLRYSTFTHHYQEKKPATKFTGIKLSVNYSGKPLYTNIFKKLNANNLNPGETATFILGYES
jgi:hypothetical protein